MSPEPSFEPMFSTPGAAGPRLENEFKPHYEAWVRDPSPETSAKILTAVKPVIDSALRTFAGGAAASPTVRSKAKLIVLDALPRYDPDRAKLRTHLMVNLQALHRAGAEEGQIVSVPERVRLEQHRLREATNELADRLGREPSDGELAEHTGLSVRRLAHVRKASPVMAEGTIRGPESDDGSEGASAVGVKSRDPGGAWQRFIYQDLDGRDQFIMEHVLGLHGKPVLPKIDIARRLGLTPGAVSQRAARIQRLLDSREELAGNLF